MNIAQWWPKLRDDTREWLVEHNGEPLDQAVSDDLTAAMGAPDPRWWSGRPGDELSDEAVDWIEARANGEDPESG